MKNAVKDKINIVYMLLTLVSILGVIFAIGLFIRDAYLETVAVETFASFATSRMVVISVNLCSKYNVVSLLLRNHCKVLKL